MGKVVSVKVKRFSEKAVIPSYAFPGDAGLDLIAIDERNMITPSGLVTEYDTGIGVEIPDGHFGLVVPRSSITSDTTLILQNSVGIIDSGYRGSIKFRFKTLQMPGKKYKLGDKIGQLIVLPIPKISFEEVNEFSTTERGDG
jgi:dUTP pyrophosphatase